MQALFSGLFLGGVDRLLPLMDQSFHVLGLVKQDCIELSWIKSVLCFAGFQKRESRDVLLERTTILEGFLKVNLITGKMSEISESKIPFRHRAGNICQIEHLVVWAEEGIEASQRHINWIGELYSYLTPYVSKDPREAYINYKDLDIGMNNEGYTTNYKQASIWGV
ncbi:Berberine bridge enzyme-like 22 [Citrus sinensis]|nr:Berberine bridge enzyme-like 22 [Citrus sinensis]